MILLVGLGNPGAKFQNTVHNAGFCFIEALHQKYAPRSNLQENFGGRILITFIETHKVIFFKPESFMNLSGEPVKKTKAFFKINNDNVFIIHDDIDLQKGSVKCKKGGGHAGHNGLKDIDKNIGGDYWRIRIGVGRPGSRDLVSDYVLSPLGTWVQPVIEEIVQNIPSILDSDLQNLSKLNIKCIKQNI